MKEKLKETLKKIKEKLIEKKKLIFTILILIPVLILIYVLSQFAITYENGKRYDNYIFIPDITGYDENDAIEKLEKLGFLDLNVEYIIDQYTPDGCVIKTNKHIKYKSRPDEKIIIYVCKKSDDIGIKEDISATNKYFSMNNMTIIDIATYDDKFSIIVKNNNIEAITHIEYKIGYLNEEGKNMGENKYQLDGNITIMPGEKYTITDEIKNKSASSLYVSGFSYNKIKIPNNERIE